jgi:hypothetical protein
MQLLQQDFGPAGAVYIQMIPEVWLKSLQTARSLNREDRWQAR